MIKWRDESDLRAWVREQWGTHARFIEPAMGSTMGLPDCVVIQSSRTYWLELKKASFKKGVLRFDVTNDQVRELPRMVADGAWVRFLIAVVGTQSLVVSAVSKEALAGAIPAAMLSDCAWCKAYEQAELLPVRLSRL